MAARIRPISIYARIARTYARRAPSLLLLAVVVFVPLGLIDAITVNTEVGSLSLSNGLLLAAAVAAVVALTITGLIGEVFYSGAVAISLTQAEHGRAPSLREISRRLNYRRLIAVDLLYGLIVAVGLILLLAPGVAAFAWLGLAGPVVEIEGRSVRGAFRRSWDLVRGQFWTVLLVLGSIEVAAGRDLGTRGRSGPPPAGPLAVGDLGRRVALQHPAGPNLCSGGSAADA